GRRHSSAVGVGGGFVMCETLAVLVLEQVDSPLSPVKGFRTVSQQPGSLEPAGVCVTSLAVRKASESVFTDRVFVGRTANSDIVIDDGRVSKLHAYFQRVEGGELRVVDAGSTNGTRVNGERIAPNTPTPVAFGAVVAFGPFVFRVTPPERAV